MAIRTLVSRVVTARKQAVRKSIASALVLGINVANTVSARTVLIHDLFNIYYFFPLTL